MIDDDIGLPDRPPMTTADRVAYWLPRVSLALGIAGALVWWWVA